MNRIYEQVIKGLECCKIPFTKCYNGGCPYFENEGCKARLKSDALALLKAQEPRVATWDEVKKKINSGEYVFTECEKEGQWMRYGDAKLSVDQGDSCRIAFLISRRGDNPYVRWWWISYKNYNKTWRCWTSRPTDEQMEAVKWDD